MKYQLISTPKKAFGKMISDIRKAKKEILLETYIYDNDKTGRAFRDVLIDKAKQGVTVRILVDSWGSGVNKKFFRELVLFGGEVRFFRKFRYTFRLFSENHERNHRKLLLIDKKISYLGSLNITSDSLNWRELVLRSDGELAISLRKSFNLSWKRFNFLGYKRIRKMVHEGIEILSDHPTGKVGRTERSYRRLIRSAKKDISIETPYFIPSPIIRKALYLALKRGVCVRIVLPRSSDNKFSDVFRGRYFGALYRAGVEIYYHPKVLHSKLLIIDDERFLFGSSNLDFRSFRHQFEINLLGRDGQIIELLKKYFNRTIRGSSKFNYRSWRNRNVLRRILDNIIVKVIEPFKEYF